jgi:hypothetical protein
MQEVKVSKGKKNKEKDGSKAEKEFLEFTEVSNIAYYSMKSSLCTSFSFNYYIWKLFTNLK